MKPDAQTYANPSAAPLVVADWTIDPEPVVTAIRARVYAAPGLRILVPAWLHGIDWVGDPWASVPCARRQLDRIAGLCAAAGLCVVSAEVGDPDPVSAICDAVAAGGVDRILLFSRGRHVSSIYPLSVLKRAERLTGVPVQGFAAPHGPGDAGSRHFVGGHCRAPQLA
jgi:hypothetical protein